MTNDLVPHQGDAGVPARLSPLEVLAQVPEEELWLANFTSKSTRATYKESVASFVRSVGLTSAEDFRKVGRAAVIAWRDQLERDGHSIRTIKTRLSALSSLFRHLKKHDLVASNPVEDVEAPRLRVRRGETKALSVDQARKLLDAPPTDTLQGLRDRAILAVGLQVGPRRAEIAKLKVRDFHEEQEFPALRLKRKRGSIGSVVIHQSAAQRIRAYLERSGHGEDKGASLFLPMRGNQLTNGERRHLTPKQIDRIFKRWAKKVALPADLSSHCMRATFITRALENGASIEDVQEAAGHAHSSTTQLYDRRGYNPERAASLFATY